MGLRLGMPPLLRTTVAVLLLPLQVVASTGCYSWAVAPEGTAVAAHETQDRLRLTLTDGRRTYLYNARMISDSLVGTSADGQAAFSLAQVRTVEVSRFSTGKTVLAVGMPVVLVALAVGGWVVYASGIE